jgi:hypothetical protein
MAGDAQRLCCKKMPRGHVCSSLSADRRFEPFFLHGVGSVMKSSSVATVSNRCGRLSAMRPSRERLARCGPQAAQPCASDLRNPRRPPRQDRGRRAIRAEAGPGRCGAALTAAAEARCRPTRGSRTDAGTGGCRARWMIPASAPDGCGRRLRPRRGRQGSAAPSPP